MINLKLIQLIGLILISNWAFTQDLIFLKSGKEIKTKVIEVGELQIKYKKFVNLEGPTYTIMKSDVFMIKYENGEKDIFKKQDNYAVSTQDSESKIFITTDMPRSGIRRILRKNPLAYNKYNEGRDLYLAGMVIMIPSSLVLGWQLGATLVENIEHSETALILSGTGVVIALVLAIIGESKVKESIHIYNRNSTSLGFAPVINSNGVGLGLKINF